MLNYDNVETGMEVPMSTFTEKIIAGIVASVVFTILCRLLFTGFVGEVWNWWQINAVLPAYEKPLELPTLIISLFVIPVIAIMIPPMMALLTFKAIAARPH